MGSNSAFKVLSSGGDQPSHINTVDVNNSNVRSHSDECSIEIIETEEEVPQNGKTVCDNTVDEKVHCFTAKFESLHQAFRTSEVSINPLKPELNSICYLLAL